MISVKGELQVGPKKPGAHWLHGFAPPFAQPVAQTQPCTGSQVPEGTPPGFELHVPPVPVGQVAQPAGAQFQ